MKCLTAVLAAMLLLARAEASHALIRITNDRGGQIGRYVDRYEKLRASGQAIVIDGLCASACTIVLGTVPYDSAAGRIITPSTRPGISEGADGLFRIRKQPKSFFQCIHRRSSAGSPVAAACLHTRSFCEAGSSPRCTVPATGIRKLLRRGASRVPS